MIFSIHIHRHRHQQRQGTAEAATKEATTETATIQEGNIVDKQLTRKHKQQTHTRTQTDANIHTPLLCTAGRGVHLQRVGTLAAWEGEKTTCNVKSLATWKVLARWRPLAM